MGQCGDALGHAIQIALQGGEVILPDLVDQGIDCPLLILLDGRAPFTEQVAVIKTNPLSAGMLGRRSHKFICDSCSCQRGDCADNRATQCSRQPSQQACAQAG